MVPSTGIEPVAFPMSRERATAAPTGRKSTFIISYLFSQGKMPIVNKFIFVTKNLSILNREIFEFFVGGD